MPRFTFAPNPITIPVRNLLLEHRAIATRNALSNLKGNYHLFLRNQPQAPVIKQRRLVPKRVKRWRAPRVDLD